MDLFAYLQARNWTTLLGYAFFIGMLAVGYYYNVTFVQLGLVDLGERLVGLSGREVANNMAYLALITSAVALLAGLWMQKRGWSQQFIVKLRLSFAVILVQTILTAVAPLIRSEGGFLAWIVIASIALGVGVPVTFGMMVHLIPWRDRGYVAAIITAIAYFAAPVLSPPWEIENFSRQMLVVMLPAVPVLGLFAFKRFSFIGRLAHQHTQPEFWFGRYVRRDETGSDRISWRLVGLIILMFGVFFVDSLGFLRMTDTPFLMESAWMSPEPGPRLLIGWVHVVAALAFLTVRWLPRPVSRVANALVKHALVSIALGLLVGVVGITLLVLIAFTIILIPVSLLAGLLFFLTILYGWIAFGPAVGRFLVRQFNWDLQPAPAAALSTLLFVLVLNVLSLIPLLEIAPLLLAVAGLGAVFLTRFGMTEFVPAADRPEVDF